MVLRTIILVIFIWCEQMNHIIKCKPAACLVLAAVLLAALLCAGCVQTESQEKALTFVFNQGPATENNFDPAQGWDGWYIHQAGVYETLFYYDKDMVLTPKLAESYKTLSDTKWEIQLRKGVVFHDGTPFNADAVIFSYNRVLDPSNSRSAEYSFISDVRKTGEYTIVIETTEPYAPTIASLVDPVMSIVSPNIINAASNPVGTGPYAFVSASSGAKDIYLKKHTEYWGGNVGCDTIHIIVNADATARTMLIKSGEADIVRDPTASEYQVLESGDTYISSTESLRGYFLIINEGRAPFDNVNVRKALSYALDRQEIVDTALEGVKGTPAIGIFSNSLSWNANDKILHYDYNQEKALSLLAEAGITKGADGKLIYNGKPFTIEIITYTSRAALPASLEVIAAQYEKLGITVNIKHMDKTETAMNAEDFDMSLYSAVTAPTGDPDYFLSSYVLSSSRNAKTWSHYANPQVDEWILEARISMDNNVRRDLYDKIQMEIQNEAVYIPVFFGVEGCALSDAVSGFAVYPNDYTYVTAAITKQ